MKKRIKIITKIVSITMAIFITNTVVNAQTTGIAKINNDIYNTLKEAVEAAIEGDTITLIDDGTETEVINIDKGITINGDGHKIISNSLSGTQAAILINTSSKIIISDINIETNTRGIAINSSLHDVTVNNSTLNVGQRGITINTDDNINSSLNINDCIIQTNKINNYDEEVLNDGSRGISLWEYQNSTIEIKNTTIQGFSYAINITSEYTYDSKNTKIIIDNCIIKGRSGINYSNNTGIDMELKNSEILGINNEKGTSERYGNIVIYSSSNINLNIKDTKFLNYQNEIGTANAYALQYIFDIRSGGNTINITGDTSGIDTTNKITDIFTFKGIPESDTRQNKIEITGGTYSYDVTTYVKEGYESTLEDGIYQVNKSKPIIEINELDLDDETKEGMIGSVNTSQTEQVLLDTLAKTEEVEIENKNIKVIIDMDTIEISDTVKEDFNKNKKIENGILTNFFDISINIIDTKTNGILGNLTKIEEEITFAIILPSDLPKIENGYQRKYYIIREHDNSYDLIEPDLASDGLSITFQTDKFSTYALMYVDEKMENLKISRESNIENPKTYDGIMLYIAIDIISFIGAISIATYIKVKER